LFKIARIVAGILFAGSVMALIGPLIGEVIATLPPIFSKQGINPLGLLQLPYEVVEFPTSDSLTLRGWFIPSGASDSPAIVYAPGTGHDQTSGLHIVRALHEAGYHLLLFSYRGHGESDGNELGFTYGEAESVDLDAAVTFLSERKRIERIGVIGFSAGASTAILSAARNSRIDAVVAAAPFASISEIWRTNSPSIMPGWYQDWTMRMAELRKGFKRENVEPISVIHQISPRPILIVQGEADRRVTVSQAEKLFASAGSPRELWVVKDATHSMVHEQALVSLEPQIIAFLDNALQHTQTTAQIALAGQPAKNQRVVAVQ